MGLGRGMAHVKAALAIPNVELAYVCDVDQQEWIEKGNRSGRGPTNQTQGCL